MLLRKGLGLERFKVWTSAFEDLGLTALGSRRGSCAGLEGNTACGTRGEGEAL